MGSKLLAKRMLQFLELVSTNPAKVLLISSFLYSPISSPVSSTLCLMLHPEGSTGPAYLAGQIYGAVSVNQIVFNDNLLVLLQNCDRQWMNCSPLAASQHSVLLLDYLAVSLSHVLHPVSFCTSVRSPASTGTRSDTR